MTDSPAETGPGADRTWHPVEGLDPDPASITGPVCARAGGEVIVIVKTASGYRATERACPHQKATLTEAIVMGNGTNLRCPKHNFVFRLSDGKGINCPGLWLKVFEVREAGGRLEVAL